MKQPSTYSFRIITAGLSFAFLWASASAATRIGLESAQPFIIAVPRFFFAGVIMLLVAHGVMKKRMPQQREWKQLAVYGLLNVSIYLGLYVIAMQEVSAGLGSLSVGTNPVFISIIGAIWTGKKIPLAVVASLLLCMSGITIAAWPLLQDSYATPMGIMLLLVSMLSYSIGAIYFSERTWGDLHILTINGWQTLLGGVFLLPLAAIFYDSSMNQFDTRWIASVGWLALPVSIGAVQLWLYLLKDNPVKASFWLFLTPVFGFVIAAVMLHEPISMYTLMGVAFVIAGLYLVQKKKGNDAA